MIWVLISAADASQIRVATLGGDSRLLSDNTDIFAFPARAVDFPHASFEIFDEWAGLVLPVRKAHFGGLFFNRPTRQVTALNNYVHDNGTPVFGQLDVSPWVDMLYARNLSERLNIGLAGRLSYDVLEIDGRKASAKQSDLRVGLRLGTNEGAQLDVAVGTQRHDLRDTINPVTTVRETDGTGITGGIRLSVPLGEQFQMIHFIGIESGSYCTCSEPPRDPPMGTGDRPELHADAQHPAAGRSSGFVSQTGSNRSWNADG